MAKTRQSVPVVITRHYDLMLWLMQQVTKFPRSYKFVLGDRIQTQALDILEQLIEAAYSREKREVLRHAGLGVEKLRYLIRCAHDLELFDERRYLYITSQLDEVGRMIGGWQRTQPNETTR